MGKNLETELRTYLDNVYYQEGIEESTQAGHAYEELKSQIDSLGVPFKVGDGIVSKAIEVATMYYDDGFIAGYKHALLMLGLTDKKESL